MANTENIEARLCAYVDGELDDAGRAEIEAHLSANPQHRQLLEELRNQRALLAGLPRVRAPEDLADAMQTHLERSVLLHEPDAPPVVAGRISRIPRYFAAAAVVLLGIGLIAVIVMVLPSKRHASEVAIGRPAASSSPTGTPAEGYADRSGPTHGKLGVATVQDETMGARRNLNKPAAAPVRESTAGAPVDRDMLKGGLAMKAEPKQPSGDVFAKQSPPQSERAAKNGAVYSNIFATAPRMDASAVDALRRSGGVAPNAPVVVVASNNPMATDEQVRNYLSANNIHWEPASEPMPRPIDFAPSQVVLPSRLQNNIDMRLKDAQGQAQQKEMTDQTTAVMEQRQLASTVPTQPSGAPDRDRLLAAAAPASTQPAPAAQAVRQRASQEFQVVGGQEMEQPASVSPTATTRPTAQARLIVARGLTARQVSELNTTLTCNNAGRVIDYGMTRAEASTRTANLAPPPPLGASAAGATGAATFPAIPRSPSPTTQRAGTTRPAISRAPTPSPALSSIAPSTQPLAAASTQPIAEAAKMDVIIYVQPAPVEAQHPLQQQDIQVQQLLPATAPAAPAPASAPSTHPAN